ncbi:hypothetical protein [Levilactobacillus brevis]|uniref:hypothetical protein n=1 Tax=Levilactobacillus brevis TaxID=1580 RepID=UPI00111987B0|nr:hypothetical protein [Levilactobacillus brevis]QCZ46804.1 Hypothetical protein UCCLB556_1927 [Levilactobacillus brevis]
MIDTQMWRQWIREKMVSNSQRSVPFDVGSEAYLMGRDELDWNLIPGNFDIDDLPKQVMVYMYGTDNNAILGYILASEELDVMYLAGVIVDGNLCWSQIGDESE